MVSGSDALILRLIRIGGDGEVTTLGKVLLALLLTELDVKLVTVTSEFLRLEGTLGLEVLGAVLWDFVHGKLAVGKNQINQTEQEMRMCKRD